jgi:hypothetical protein
MSDCNNVLAGFSGVINNPQPLSPYYNSLNCTWLIQGTTGNTINATFILTGFETATNTSCNTDYFEVRLKCTILIIFAISVFMYVCIYLLFIFIIYYLYLNIIGGKNPEG